MRVSLIVFGVIFLVVGVLLYVIPMQEISADTNTAGTEGAAAQTASASLTVPVGWAYAAAIIGFIFLVLGLALPGSVTTVQGPRGQRGSRGRASEGTRGPRGPRGRGAASGGASVTTTTRTSR